MVEHGYSGLTQQANRRPMRGRKPAGGPVARRVRRHWATFAFSRGISLSKQESQVVVAFKRES
jgi:hypothetical protein